MEWKKGAVRTRLTGIAAGFLGVAFLAVGCSPPPPCEISATEVQSAQSSAKAAEQSLQQAKKERADLEAQLRAKRDELANQQQELDQLKEERREPITK
jgi:septal ring factor EnvC (AmiA/AmiB activator)